MLIQDRKSTRIVDYSAATLIGVLFLIVGLGTPGFWEPWESGLVQLADFLRFHGDNPHIFWVPQTENHLVYKPLAQIWTLMAVQSLVDQPSEFLLRLPGALLALGVMLTGFAVMRRFFSRGAAFAMTLALVSLPIFVFGARLLAAGIWPIAGVSLPLMLYLLANWGESALQRMAWGTLFGLSFAFCLLAGGLPALTVVLGTLLCFGLWRRKTYVLRAYANAGFAVGFAAALAIGGYVIGQYHTHVPWALEDRIALEPARVANALRAGKIADIGERDGVIVGMFDEAFVEEMGAERFVVSVDGREHGTAIGLAWARLPDQMKLLEDAALEAGYVDEDGTWGAFDVPPPDTGATRTTLEFLTYDLYDPAVLAERDKARVRSTVGAAPALGVVRAEPEDTDAFLLRLVNPLVPRAIVAEEKETRVSPEAAKDPLAKQAAARAAERKRATAKQEADKKRAAAAARSAEVGKVRNGQDVTILGADGLWSEVEMPGGKTGWIRTDTLEPKASMEAGTFDRWVRYLGFGLFPWILLIPAALGVLLLRRGHSVSEETDAVEDVGGFLLLWFAIAVGVMGIGAAYLNLRTFTGVLPVALSSGVLLSSRRYWAQVDTAPMLKKFVGFGAICILGVMIHDYKKNPWLFIDSYLHQPEMEWEETLQVLLLPWRIFRVLVAGLIAGWFFGGIGFVNRMVGRVVYFARWRFSRQIEAIKALDKPGQTFGDLSGKGKIWRVVSAPWTYFLRYVALAGWGAMQLIREPRVVLVLIGLGSAVLTTFVYLPAMSHHLTQKGLLLRYEELAEEGEPLVSMQAVGQRSCRLYSDCEPGFSCVRGRCKPEATSFYLGHVENMAEKDLIDQFMEDGRKFAIIPRKKLARVNSQFRRRFEVGKRENLAVLDTRSSRFLLVSNDVKDGEEDENYISDLILDTPPTPEYPVRKPLRFTNGLEFVGYDLDPDEVGSGEELTITYYFHVTKDITQDWQMFLHIDYPGNRINGDHYPGDGEFHTNTWLAGDYIKDIQKLEIDRGSSAGLYEMWFGFFSGGDARLSVETGDKDNTNRVRMGGLRVTGGI